MLREPLQGRVWNFALNSRMAADIMRGVGIKITKRKKWNKTFVDMFHRSHNDPELVPNISRADVNTFSGFSAVCKTAATVCYDRGHG